MMRKLPGILCFFAAHIAAQTVETIPYRQVMSTLNEVPAITDLSASGTSILWLHLVRNAAGEIVSGSVDFNVNYAFPGDVTFTGLHIHNGPAGVNAGVTVNTGLSGTNSVNSPTGRGTISRQAQVAPGDAAGLATLRGILQNPENYYVNLHTTVHPGGAIRAQLQRADLLVLMGQMSPRNEVPAIADSEASGMASVLVIATRDSFGGVTSAQVVFDVNYAGFPDGTRFTGFHIHDSPAGVNGPVTINTGIAGGVNAVPAGAGGAGNLHYEVDVTTAAGLATVEGLFRNSVNHYINLHNERNPGGEIRAQLRRTDRMVFPVTMLTSNEVPAVNLDATGPAVVTVHTLRDTSGQVVAGTVIFDVNHRFPGEATFTGLHIHDGVAGQNGGVTINTGLSGTNSVVTTSGSGNIFRIVNVNNQAGLATLNSLVRNPENHYVNLHTTVHPGGAVRSQLLPANTAAPSIGAIISAVSEPTLRTVAPGGLMTIFGTNLVKAPTDLSGWAGDSVPLSLNGVQATIAGTRAPILIVDRDHLVVQVPNEVSAGAQPVVVTNPNGATASSTVTVAASAPGIFFGPLGAVALRNSDYSVIGPDNPARAGDLLLIYATGFGQPTTPTGRVTPFTDPLPRKSGVRATLGGRDVDVIYALSSPGLVGVDQFVIRVAEGIPAGNANLVVRIGDATSNTVTVAVR